MNQPTKRKQFRSEYDGKLYRDEIAATVAMLEAETCAPGEHVSRAAAEVWLDREADARNSRF